MLHGKKGFDRIVHAFKNVLNQPITWLFLDLEITDISPGPIDAYFPSKIVVEPKVIKDIRVNIPPLQPPTNAHSAYEADFETFAYETLEWLSLISLDSPRIEADDKIDSFLCRYASPVGSKLNSKLVTVTWRGFLAPDWVYKNFVKTLLATPRDSWFAYSIAGLGEGWSNDGKNCTILKPPEAQTEYILWEVE